MMELNINSDLYLHVIVNISKFYLNNLLRYVGWYIFPNYLERKSVL